MGIMVLLSLLVLGTACGNNEKSATAGQSTTIANHSVSFTVLGLECCPPSVIQDSIQKVDGVSKVDIEPMGSKGKVTVAFDDKKTDLNQTSVTQYGFGVTGG